MISKFRRKSNSSLKRKLLTSLLVIPTSTMSFYTSADTVEMPLSSADIVERSSNNADGNAAKRVRSARNTANMMEEWNLHSISADVVDSSLSSTTNTVELSYSTRLDKVGPTRPTSGVTVSGSSRDYQGYLSDLNLDLGKIAPLTENATVQEYGGGARVIWAMSAGDREAEGQAKKGEETTSNDRDSRAAHALKTHWCVGLRAVELVLAVIAIGLVSGGFYTSQSLIHVDHRHMALVYSAYSTFIIITGVLVIGRLFGETVGWRTSLGFSVLGVIMFTAAAAVIFYDVSLLHGWTHDYYQQDWHQSYYTNLRSNKIVYDLMVASGVFAVLDAAVFLLHAVFTCRKDAEY